MKTNRFLWFSAMLFAATIYSSCVTMADYDFTEIDSSLRAGNYEAVYQSLEADESLLYKEQDKVLMALDKGIVSHYSGDYERSNESLSLAERLIFENFSKSISQSISSFLLNDTVVDYSGETFEDIYTNLFMALNYIHLGKTEDAFVEIRRFDNKLKTVSAQYADLIAKANQSNIDNGVDSVESPNLEFHNSALARYLSMILYRSVGKMDSARIDKNYIENAFELQPSLYDFAVPSCVESEFFVPKEQARVNVIAFSGRAPIKTEEVMRLYSYDGSIYYKLALPVMKKMPSVVHGAKVEVYGSDGVLVASSDLEKIESMDSIAMDTFQQKQALVHLKAVARAFAKSTTTAVLDGLSETAEDAEMGLLFSVFHMVSVVATEVSERADVRSSRYFPSTAWVAGVNVPPGNYSVKITYKNISGSVVGQETQQMTVGLSQINLVESVCLR